MTKNAANGMGRTKSPAHATDPGPVREPTDEAKLRVWLLGHPQLRDQPEMVRVALQVFFHDHADALHAQLLAGKDARAPGDHDDPAGLARTLRNFGFRVALRRHGVAGAAPGAC